MNPLDTGKKYDKIAQWWHDKHDRCSYGVDQFNRALQFATVGGSALDVGCGAGGRFIRILQDHNYSICGLDASEHMISLARKNHPEHEFIHHDICTWESDKRFDFIVAWDSLFHLPRDMQGPVLTKLCRLLAHNGVLIYTFGNANGEHTDQWHDDTFYYSSIGISENIQIMMGNRLSLLHLELDQYPEKHVYAIASKI
jgi:2-polyprenyl-3-methyl-5-hydroxy-6-metoxy-1,4-benzoquinol methylase